MNDQNAIEPAAPAGDPPAADGTTVTTQTLSALMGRTPFLDLYERSGSTSRWAFRACFALDGLLRIVAVSLVVAILALLAWKGLAPLPVVTATG